MICNNLPNLWLNFFDIKAIFFYVSFSPMIRGLKKFVYKDYYLILHVANIVVANLKKIYCSKGNNDIMRLVKPKKFLGQHFLKDLHIAKNIADTVDVCPDIPVLEVGPGMGVLTQYLLSKNRPVTVVELDFESVAYLRQHFNLPDENIIEQDFLRMDLSKIFKGNPFVLTGNYPYNISSQIFFKMLEYKDWIPCCTGMIQKEVAERIAARPGSKIYGILSVLIQAWYNVEYLFTVNESVFNPPPKVKSAVIRMTRNDATCLGCNEQLFKQIVKTTFNQRRKTLRNSISSILDKANPLSQDPLFNKRPEQLSVNDFVELTNKVEEAIRPQE